MHNLYAIFAKYLNMCKQVSGNLVNESGNPLAFADSIVYLLKFR